MTTQGIYTGWVMILGAIGPLAMLLGFGSLGFAVTQYVIMLAMTAIIALIVDFLTPWFGGPEGLRRRAQLSAFSYTRHSLPASCTPLGGRRGRADPRRRRSTPVHVSISARRC